MANRESAYIEITPEVLLKAYACGIFPMAESAEDPSLHWMLAALAHIGMLVVAVQPLPTTVLAYAYGNQLDAVRDCAKESLVLGEIDARVSVEENFLQRPSVLLLVGFDGATQEFFRLVRREMELAGGR